MSNCNGHMYVAWAGSNDEINVAWDWNFSTQTWAGKVTYADTDLAYDSGGIYGAPVLACWKPASGYYAGTTHLWIFYTGTATEWGGTYDNIIYGVFSSNDVNGQELDGQSKVPNQTTQRTIALAVRGGTLSIGWAGLSNLWLNFESTNDAANFYSPNFWQAQKSAMAFGMLLWNGNLWFIWPGTGSRSYLNSGYFGIANNAGQWIAVRAGSNHLVDYVCPGCDAGAVPQGSTLRVPYAGGNFNLNVDNTTDGSNFSDDQSAERAVFGAGGAVDGGNHFWLTWVDNVVTGLNIGKYN
jgi:hypothetical protein